MEAKGKENMVLYSLHLSTSERFAKVRAREIFLEHTLVAIAVAQWATNGEDLHELLV